GSGKSPPGHDGRGSWAETASLRPRSGGTRRGLFLARGRVRTMEEGTSGIGANRNGHGGLDPEELARRIRQLAIDAHRILTRADTSIGEVSGLRRRVRVLLRETR